MWLCWVLTVVCVGYSPWDLQTVRHDFATKPRLLPTVKLACQIMTFLVFLVGRVWATRPQSSSGHTLLPKYLWEACEEKKWLDSILMKMMTGWQLHCSWKQWERNRVSWSSARWLVVPDRSAFCRVCTTEDGSDDFMIWGTVSDWQAPRLDWLVFLSVNAQYSLKKIF